MDVERFESLIDWSGDCWLWKGTVHESGYGRYNARVEGRLRQNWFAHRLAYYLYEEDPGASHCHHVCGEKLCVNPAHIELMTPSAHRGIQSPAPRRSCPLYCCRGHSLMGEANVYYEKGGRLRRRCRLCQRIRKNRNRARRVARGLPRDGGHYT